MHNGELREFHWSRLPAAFHGAGCTLASAIAGRIAIGEDWAPAIEQAQRYTHPALSRAYRTGRGRLIPRRGQCTPRSASVSLARPTPVFSSPPVRPPPPLPPQRAGPAW